MALKIQLLGRPAIITDDGTVQDVRGNQAWALLARILLADQPLDRRRLAAELFPDAVDPLGALRWCLAALRRSLGTSTVLTGDPVQANLPDDTEVDVLMLRDGAEGLPEEIGDLLEGIEPRSSSAEFSTWLLVTRERVAAMVTSKLRQEVLRAISAGRYDRAIRLSEQAVRRDTFNEGAHILLVKSLAGAGSLEAARRHVTDTERLFETELGVAPSPALRGAVRKTVSSPPADVSAEAVVRSLIDSGCAALAAGAADAGVDCLRRAVAESESVNNRWLYAKALQELGVALVHSVRGYDDEGAILIRQSVDVAEDCDAPDLITAGYRELGYVDALAGRRPEAARNLEQAEAVAEGADAEAGILAVRGFNLVDWGMVAPGVEKFSASVERARAAGSKRREIWSLGIGSWGHLAAGDPETAEAWLTESLTLIEQINWLGFRPWPLALRAETRLQLGDPPGQLRDDLFQTFALSCQMGDPCWEALTARVIGLTYAQEGALDQALDWLTQARQRCLRETDFYAGLLVRIYADQAEIAQRAGDAAQANALARELLSLSARTHTDSYIETATAIIAGTAAPARASAHQ